MSLKEISSNMHARWQKTVVSYPTDCYYHGAVIFSEKGKGFNELSFGINHEPPSYTRGTIHAERAAINKLPYLDLLIKTIKGFLLVIRFTPSGKLGNSKCCFKCIYDMINIPITKGYKITKVYYSNRDGEIIKTNLKKLDR